MCKFIIAVMAAITIGVGIPSDAFAHGNTRGLGGALDLSRVRQIRVLASLSTLNSGKLDLNRELKTLGTLSTNLHSTLNLRDLSGNLATGNLTLLTSAQLSPTVIPIPPEIRIGGSISKEILGSFRTDELRLGGLVQLGVGML